MHNGTKTLLVDTSLDALKHQASFVAGRPALAKQEYVVPAPRESSYIGSYFCVQVSRALGSTRTHDDRAKLKLSVPTVPGRDTEKIELQIYSRELQPAVER